MQISSNPAAAAAQNIAKSTQIMNQLNQTILDTSQDLSGKLIRIVNEEKVAGQEKAGKLNLLA